MALDDTFNIVRPNANNGGADTLELVIEEFTGMVEGTIDRRSALKGWVNVKPVKGTATLTNFAVGQSTLQKITPGTTPDGTVNDFAKRNLTVDTTVIARAVFPILEVFQTSFEARKEVASEHGKIISKFWDQVMFIQAIKASLQTESSYTGNAAGATAGKPAGHSGGSQETLALAGDLSDPAKLYAAIARLMAKIEAKDVDPQNDDLIIACKPSIFYTLLQAEQLINAEYITAEGNKVQGMVLKTYGVPVIRSNNYKGGEVVAGQLLSNVGNGAAYDGDFSKVVLTAMSPKALLAGETIPLTTEVFYDNVTKNHFVDAHLAFAATFNRCEYAGSILIP